jgi:hypothetical protein
VRVPPGNWIAPPGSTTRLSRSSNWMVGRATIPKCRRGWKRTTKFRTEDFCPNHEEQRVHVCVVSDQQTAVLDCPRFVAKGRLLERRGCCDLCAPSSSWSVTETPTLLPADPHGPSCLKQRPYARSERQPSPCRHSLAVPHALTSLAPLGEFDVRPGESMSFIGTETCFRQC